MMDLGAFQPAIAMIFHVESEFAVQNAGFLRPDPEKYRIFPDLFRKKSGTKSGNIRFSIYLASSLYVLHCSISLLYSSLRPSS